MQELPPPWQGWLGLVYQCRHVSGTPTPDGRETDAARYFSAADMNALGEPIEPWSEWLVRRVFVGTTTLIRNDSTNPFPAGLCFL